MAITCRSTLAAPEKHGATRYPLSRRREEELVAGYRYFCGGNFQAHQPMGGVQEEEDFEVGRGHAETLVRFAVGGCWAGGLDGDGAGSELLRDEHGEILRAALGPIVHACEHAVL